MLVSILMAGCLKRASDGYIPPATGDAEYFDYSTTKEYAISVDYNTVGVEANGGAVDFAIYDVCPYMEVESGDLTRQLFIGSDDAKYSVGDDGGLVAPATEQPVKLADGSPALDGNGSPIKTIEPLFRAITGPGGEWEGTAILPSHIESGEKTVWIHTKWANSFTGVPEIVEVKLQGNSIAFPSGVAQARSTSSATRANSGPAGSGILVLGSGDSFGWDDQGVPKYMLPNSPVPNQLFHDLMSIFPNTVTALHNLDADGNLYIDPVNPRQRNIVSENPFEVKLTFVHDGGDFKNCIGYYWYDKSGQVPTMAQLQSDAVTKVVAFPNTSYAFSGGNLSTGDEVQLMYTPYGGQTWTKSFPANLSLGFFMYPNGFNPSTLDVGVDTSHGINLGMIFSDCSDATFATTGQYQQMLLLKPERLNTEGQGEEQSDVLVLTVEDLLRTIRTGWEDNDFNDVVFLVKVKKDLGRGYSRPSPRR